MGLRKTETQASAALPGLVLIQLIAVLIHARADAPASRRLLSFWARRLGNRQRRHTLSGYSL
jgi:hypothetical protein